MISQFKDFPFQGMAARLADALTGGRGWALIYMPLLGGIIWWSMPAAITPQKTAISQKTAMLQKTATRQQGAIVKTMGEIDARLEGLEVAIMGLQVHSQSTIGDLKQIRKDVGHASLAVTRLYWLTEQMKQTMAASVTTQKTGQRNVKLKGAPKSLTATRRSVPVSRPGKAKQAKVKSRMKQAQAVNPLHNSTNFRAETDPVNQP